MSRHYVDFYHINTSNVNCLDLVFVLQNLETGLVMSAEVQQPGSWSNRVAIPGARKIWNTKMSTKEETIFTTIETLTSMPTDEMTIKKKYKLDLGKRKIEKWHFVIRADESILLQLDQAWITSAMQQKTGWKLLPLLKYPSVSETVSLTVLV